jgi:hypothetical protein
MLKNSKPVSDLPHINVYGRLAFLERICDDLPSARTLSFDDLYKRWQEAQFFNQLVELGFLQVSYNGGEFIDFDSNPELCNQHQALALSCFLASHYENSTAAVSSPHSKRSTFEAVFSRISNYCVEYVSEYGSKVVFKFDSSKPSQFI